MRSTHVWLGLMLVAALVMAPAIASAQTSTKPATKPAASSSTAPKAPAKAKPAPAKTPTAPAATSTSAAVTDTAAAVTPTGPEGAAPPRSFPFTGYINADSVYVRSGPGLYYYPLMNLTKDTGLTAVAESNGWLAVAPPAGVFGLVKKADLVIAADGKAASVDADTTRVYAGSDSAKRQWCVMATLTKGDAVKILGPAEDDMVKIVPPDSARAYVATAYVTAGTSPNGPPVKVEVLPVDPLIEELNKVDAALRAEADKPLAKQDYTAIGAALKDLEAKADKDYLKKAIAERQTFIVTMTNQQRDYQKALDIRLQMEKNLADIRAEEAAKVAAAEKEKKNIRVPFVATGVVQPIESLESVDYPIKYKLVDRDGTELVVLKSTVYDLAKYVGKVVGVRGQKVFMPEWRVYCVTVDDLEVLE